MEFWGYCILSKKPIVMKKLKIGLIAGIMFISASGFSQNKKHIPPPPPPPEQPVRANPAPEEKETLLNPPKFVKVHKKHKRHVKFRPPLPPAPPQPPLPPVIRKED